MDKLTVALLSGGRSAEREVSLKSGAKGEVSHPPL